MTETKGSKKLRGGYYTPKEMADFITRWVVRKESESILEPSCGDGHFIEAVIDRFQELGIRKNNISSKITGIELDSTEAKKASDRFKKYDIKYEKNIKTIDFFSQCKTWLNNNTVFDGIVGNPPFIRYQDFPESYRNIALSLIEKSGLKKNKLMNTWIPFIVGSTLLLRSGGKIGFVLPAELFQVNYASETRKFLSESYSKIIIITFKKLVFEDAQQEIIIFLGEKNGKKSHGINIIQVENINSLKYIDLENVTEHLKILENSSEKWTQYFLDQKEIELIRKLRENPLLSLAKDHLSVDVGIVTGQNKYFVLNKDQIKEHDVEKYTQKIFSRSNQLKGIIAEEDDFEESVQGGCANFLLNIPNTDYNKLPKSLQNYIDIGEKNKINEGYKCRIRGHWWNVPSIWVSDAFMLRQVNGYPKLVLNKSQATATDTLHRVKFINSSDAKYIIPAFLNSLTLAFSEITGRSYGGGVLTFEPSEVEKLPLPLNGAKKLNLSKIDKLIRDGKIDEVLDMTDRILLKDGLKLSTNEIASLRTIWKKLRDRRINRKFD